MDKSNINHCPAPKFPACLISFKRLAPAITGTLKKKENSVAANLPTDRSMAPKIVAPEREVPGIRAKHWKSPIKRAFFQESSSTVKV